MRTYKIRINNCEYIKSQEEILQMNLSPDTPVWSKGFINWMKLKDVPELNPAKDEGSSTKMSKWFKGLKSKIKKQNEEDSEIVAGAESEEDTSRNNATTSTNEGIILGDPTPKQTIKKMIWVTILLIVFVFVYALFSFIPHRFTPRQFDVCDTDSVCIDSCAYLDCCDSSCADSPFDDWEY